MVLLLELTDAKDKKHTFSLYPPGGSSVDKEPKFIPNLLLAPPTPRKSAKMVEFRSPEESALYGVLLRMIDKHKEKDAILTMEIDQKVWETRKLWGTDAFELHAFFHRLEGHFLKE